MSDIVFCGPSPQVKSLRRVLIISINEPYTYAIITRFDNLGSIRCNASFDSLNRLSNIYMMIEPFWVTGQFRLVLTRLLHFPDCFLHRHLYLTLPGPSWCLHQCC